MEINTSSEQEETPCAFCYHNCEMPEI